MIGLKPAVRSRGTLKARSIGRNAAQALSVGLGGAAASPAPVAEPAARAGASGFSPAGNPNVPDSYPSGDSPTAGTPRRSASCAP
jgi:hypothetical protein